MKDVNCALEINSSSYSIVIVETGRKVLAVKRASFNFDISSLSLVDEVPLNYLRQMMKELKQEYEFRIKNLNVCLSSYHVDIVPASAEIILHPYHQRDVRKKDIENLIEQSRLLRIDWDRSVLHSLPLEFYLDDRKFLEAPIGVYGRKFRTKSIFCIVNRNIMEEIETLADRLSLELGKVVFYPLALMSIFVLPDSEGDFLLVRMRRYRTDMAVFIEKSLVYAGYIPIGGEYIDRELAEGLGIPMSLAEEIKIEYGALTAEDLEDGREVIVKKVSSYRKIKRSRLNQILLASFRNILGSIKSNIPDEFRSRLSKVIFVGSSISLKGLANVVENELELSWQPVSLLRENYQKLPPSFWGAIGSFYFNDSDFNRQKMASGLNFWQKIVNVWDNYF